MSTVAIEINDVGLRAVGAAGEIVDSPGFAFTDGKVHTGASARHAARLQPGRVFNHFWHDLSLEPLPGEARGADSAADLAFHHLQAIQAQIGQVERVILVVPGHYSREQLSLLLGIARECDLPVQGMVDFAVAAADRPVPGRQLLHLELMLHQTVLTRLSQGTRLVRDQVTVAPAAGQLALHDAWAAVIADTFVRTTRYDPMHSAEAEQMVYDRVPEWVVQAYREGKAALAVTLGDKQHTATIKNDAIAAAGNEALRDIARRVAAASRPGEPLTLLLSDRLASVPGLHSVLRDAIPGIELVDLAPAAAATGALAREAEIVSDGDAVAFVTSVGWDAAAARLATAPSLPRPQRSCPPTHVVYGGRAWRIAETALTFGAEPAESEGRVLVSGDVQGVSGRHCTVQRSGSEVTLTDHSRYGTFVNGQRVEGTAQVHYGDIVRLGSGAQLLQLIAEQRDDGA